MKLIDLVQVGRSPNTALKLELLGTQEEIVVQRWLRVLPNKRYVGVALWRDQQVLIKAFVGRSAKRYFMRDREGVRLLQERHLNTPMLLAEGNSSDAAYLLFEYLADAESLASLYREAASSKKETVLKSALLLISCTTVSAFAA